MYTHTQVSPQPSQSKMSFVADIQKKCFFDLKEQDLGCVSTEPHWRKLFLFTVSQTAGVQTKRFELNWMSWYPIIDRRTPGCIIYKYDWRNLIYWLWSYMLPLPLPYLPLPAIPVPLTFYGDLLRRSKQFVEGQRLGRPLHPVQQQLF